MAAINVNYKGIITSIQCDENEKLDNPKIFDKNRQN